MAKYEVNKLIKKHEKNGEGVQLKRLNAIARGSAQINNNQGIETKVLKAKDHVALMFSSDVYIKPNKQIGGKAHIPRVLDIKASGMQFSREQIKEIFQYHDSDNDGFLNIREVTKAFGFLGSILPFYKAYHGMVYADTNNDGLISEDELEKLIDYAIRFINKK